MNATKKTVQKAQKSNSDIAKINQKKANETPVAKWLQSIGM